MAPAEMPRIRHQLVKRETHRCVVGCDNRASARSDDDVDGNVVGNKLLQHTDLAGAARAAARPHAEATGLQASGRKTHYTGGRRSGLPTFFRSCPLLSVVYSESDSRSVRAGTFRRRSSLNRSPWE